MIADKLENRKIYSDIDKRITRALEYIASTDLTSLAPGKHEIDGKNIYASVSEYQTKDAATTKPEGHLKYIDVQYIVSGSELIGYTPFYAQKPSVAYDQEKDVMFFDEKVSFVKIEAGMFAIFFPDDLHQPCINTGKTELVKKVVIKVLADTLIENTQISLSEKTISN